MVIWFGLMTKLAWLSHCTCVTQSVSRDPNTKASSWKIWLTSKKFLPATNYQCNYQLKTHFPYSFTNGGPLVLLMHTCGSRKVYWSWVRLHHCMRVVFYRASGHSERQLNIHNTLLMWIKNSRTLSSSRSLFPFDALCSVVRADGWIVFSS